MYRKREYDLDQYDFYFKVHLKDIVGPGYRLPDSREKIVVGRIVARATGRQVCLSDAEGQWLIIEAIWRLFHRKISIVEYNGPS